MSGQKITTKPIYSGVKVFHKYATNNSGLIYDRFYSHVLNIIINI